MKPNKKLSLNKEHITELNFYETLKGGATPDISCGGTCKTCDATCYNCVEGTGASCRPPCPMTADTCNCVVSRTCPGPQPSQFCTVLC